MTNYHQPSDEEWYRVDGTASAMVLALLNSGGPGFAGAVLTVALANVLAALPDEVAEDAITMHVDNVRKLRRSIKGHLDKMEEAFNEAEALNEAREHGRPH